MKNKCFVGYLKENKDDKNVVEYILIKDLVDNARVITEIVKEIDKRWL